MFLAASACSSHDIGRQPNENIEAVYNRETNRLEQLLYDSKGNGKTDKWSYMDGTRVLRVESDDDENGVIDRWEYDGPDQKLVKVGYSTLNDGRVNAWAFKNTDGTRHISDRRSLPSLTTPAGAGTGPLAYDARRDPSADRSGS